MPIFAVLTIPWAFGLMVGQRGPLENMTPLVSNNSHDIFLAYFSKK